MPLINAQALARNFVSRLPEFQGDTIDKLVATVEQIDGGSSSPTQQAEPSYRRGPALLHKPDARNYFRLTELPAQADMQCSTSDCLNKATLLVDSRDCEVLPFCKECANVEGAMWLAGVRR
jgi:hypothetical protein